MTSDEMLAYARAVVDGGAVKKSDVVAFMKALLAQADAEPAPEPDLQAGGPGMSLDEITQRYLPTLPFAVETTDVGIHIPRDANRFYTRLEALALVKLISDALRVSEV